MISSYKCWDHADPVEYKCLECNKLMCKKCCEVHKRSNCNGVVRDLVSTIAKELSKYKIQLDRIGVDEHKMIEEDNDIINCSRTVKEKLIFLKEKLISMIEAIDDVVEKIPNKEWEFGFRHNIKKSTIIDNYFDLLNSLQDENISLMIQIAAKENPIGVANPDANRELLKRINEYIKTFNESNEDKKLIAMLEQLKQMYNSFYEEYADKITNKFVYGNCLLGLGSAKLCKYDTESKKLSEIITIPKFSTVTQMGSNVYISGGVDKYSKLLNFFSEDSQSLIKKAPMTYSKCHHSTEAMG